jgi:hypothetical protein
MRICANKTKMNRITMPPEGFEPSALQEQAQLRNISLKCLIGTQKLDCSGHQDLLMERGFGFTLSFLQI